MYYMFFSIHVLVCLLLCVVVLLQQSKGGGLAGAFGGAGAGEAMFGARGVTTFLHKATIYLAVAFMVSSMSLVFLTAGRAGGGGDRSLSSQAAQRVPVSTSPSAVPTEVPLGTEDTVPPTAGDDIVPSGSSDVVPEGEPAQSDETQQGAQSTGEGDDQQGGSQ